MNDSERIAAAFAAGGFKRVCAEFPGVDPGTLRTRLRRLGLQRRRALPMRDWSTAEICELVRLRADGLTSAAIAKRLKRTKYSVDGQIKQMLRAKRLAPKCSPRPWTPGTRKVVDAALDQMIGHLAMRLDRTPDSLRHEIHRALRQYQTRHSAIAKRAIAV